MPFPTPFNSQSSAVATYSYEDLAENTGVQLFYGAAQTDSTSTTYFLSKSQVYSSVITATSTDTEASFAKVLDVDFDLTAFNAPQAIRGTAIFNHYLFLHANSNDGDAYEVIKVRKWDGAVETDIASNATPAGLTFTTDASLGWKMVCLKVPIPLTNFKKGEILRVTAEMWAKAGSGTMRSAFGCDPTDRDEGVNTDYIRPSANGTATYPLYATTQFKAWIPFNLDL
ncbi:MAG: hypothetical protein PHS54_02940 [Clostridia bacterium]|nr:hypothetical protein [Clostridia bacterium]